MKKSWIPYIWRVGKYYLFLLAIFFIERAIFLLANGKICFQFPANEVLSSFWHALHLDVSTACYLAVIPLLLLTLSLTFSRKWWDRILNVYTFIVIIFLVFTGLGNIILYKEWDTKLNYKIWAYLSHPLEILRTATWLQMTIGTLAGVAVSSFYYFAYRRWISQPTIQRLSARRWIAPLLLLVLLPLNFVGMRGGISGIPISQSNAYYSRNQLLNDAAVNTQWHLLKSTLRFGKSAEGNPFVWLPTDSAAHLVAQQFACHSDTCIKVLTTENPNIVIILLESWSADLIESLGGNADITPCFHNLEKEGLLFTQVYAAGHRSQEGISSIISGFPPVPVVTITDNFEKYKQLQSLPKALKQNGFQTSFHFGGDLTYGNLRAYLMAMGFETLVDEDSFPMGTPHGKLSIYDEVTMAQHLTTLRNEKSPFFSVLFTASTHSPYDVPTRTAPLTGKWEELPYLNAAKYTDYCLGQYFEQAKKEGWYDHTLFVLVADHSHRTYKQWDYYEAGYQHIPMLWVGGALKKEYRGKQWDKLCSYVDLPYTLCRQLSIQDTHFQWSNDIFNPFTAQFAMYQTNYGLGWITPQGAFGYDATRDCIYRSTFANDSVQEAELVKAKAFLQVLYQTYLDM